MKNNQQKTLRLSGMELFLMYIRKEAYLFFNQAILKLISEKNRIHASFEITVKNKKLLYICLDYLDI